jgi:DNA-binding NarL/FixJ family response regulator
MVKPNVIVLKNAPNTKPDRYLFHSAGGTDSFEVLAGPEGELPVDQAAGMLAVHCLTRNRAPGDYTILVPAAVTNLPDLMDKTQKLLEAGRGTRSVKLSRREKQVLAGVVKGLGNKEIGYELNISERTTKFHVSSLLAKFNVQGRLSLMQMHDGGAFYS